jgi:NADH:ubiquinone oxidoreductase subunit F (NADH-binding)
MWSNILPHHILGRSKINNGLLTLNMGLAKKVVKSNNMWAFESKQKLKDAFHHPSCNKCSKCLMLLDNNYNIFKNVEMGGNCILEKYFMKIKFSKYIKYLTNMCWNGQDIIHKYTSFYNDWKTTKWEKNHWALLKSKLPT